MWRGHLRLLDRQSRIKFWVFEGFFLKLVFERASQRGTEKQRDSGFFHPLLPSLKASNRQMWAMLKPGYPSWPSRWVAGSQALAHLLWPCPAAFPGSCLGSSAARIWTGSLSVTVFRSGGLTYCIAMPGPEQKLWKFLFINWKAHWETDINLPSADLVSMCSVAETGAEISSESTTQSESPIWVAGTHNLSHHLLSPSVHIIRILDWEQWGQKCEPGSRVWNARISPLYQMPCVGQRCTEGSTGRSHVA